MISIFSVVFFCRNIKSDPNKYQLTCSFLVFVVILLTIDELKKVEYIPSLTDVKVTFTLLFI